MNCWFISYCKCCWLNWLIEIRLEKWELDHLSQLVCALTLKYKEWKLFLNQKLSKECQFDHLNMFHFHKSLNFHMLIFGMALSSYKLALNASSLCRFRNILASDCWALNLYRWVMAGNHWAPLFIAGMKPFNSRMLSTEFCENNSTKH